MPSPNPSLRELFEAALELPANERGRFLDEKCGDPARRAFMERMLEARITLVDDLPNVPAAALVDVLGEPVPAPVLPPGSRIGPFELVDVLGEGGSATVFRAQRTLDGVRQEVALKLLRRGLYSPDAQRQFRRERQILSQLRHPGIARLIEGGVTDTGAAYIALDLVDGVPITEYVRDHRLDLRQRLLLFLDVCRAVDAAHRALIVHRDLKPSNVLVTDDATVKLLDFGIAKLLDADDDTQTHLPAFTPAYAAPEQRSGALITTATDVYALGVLLGELMTGERLSEASPSTPSSHVSGEHDPGVLPATVSTTRRQLRGDLDNIVLKAITPDPSLRYASAGSFAEDIERLLDGRPVAAHPPSGWYRARKFVGRHRGGVATTVMFLLAIVTALGIALWQSGVAHREARTAHEQARRAEAVRDLLVNLFDADIPSRPRGEMPDTAQLLEQGAQRALHDLSSTPAVQSDLLVSLARVYDHLALPDKGKPLLDAAIAAARHADPPDPALLGSALSERGELELSQDHYARALTYLAQAIALQKQAHPDGLALALTLDRQALAMSRTDRHAAAIADYRAALAIRKTLLPPDDPEILNSYDSLGSAYDRAGHPERATRFLQLAMEGARKRFGENHVKTAHYTKNYAANQGMLRHYPQAAALTERAVEIERTLYPKGSPDLVNGLNNLGVMDLTLGRLHAAQTALEEGRVINHQAGLDESLGQTFVLGNLARVDEVLGNRAQALELLNEAVRTATKVVGADHARTVSLQIQRARLEFETDPTTAAALITLDQRVLALPDQLAQFRARSEIEARYSLGLAQEALGEDKQAGETLQQTADQLPTDHVDPFLLPAVIALANWQHAHDDDTDAQALLHTTIDRAQRELPSSHYALGEMHLVLAELLAPSQPKEALTQASAAEHGFAELPESHPWRARLVVLKQRLHDNGYHAALSGAR